MGDPDYAYRPMTVEHKNRLSEVHRKRWGAPEGMCTLRGVHIPFEYREDLMVFANRIAQREGKEKARAWVQELKDGGWRRMPEIKRLAEEWRMVAENRELIRWLPYGGEP